MEYRANQGLQQVVNKSRDFIKLLSLYEKEEFGDPDINQVMRSTKFCISQMYGLLMSTVFDSEIEPLSADNHDDNPVIEFVDQTTTESATFEEQPCEEQPCEEAPCEEATCEEATVQQEEKKSVWAQFSTSVSSNWADEPADEPAIWIDPNSVQQTEEETGDQGDVSVFSAIVDNNGEKTEITHVVPVSPKMVRPEPEFQRISREKPGKPYSKMTIDELAELDMSKIPDKMVHFHANIIAHTKFRMFAYEDEDFIRSLSHGGFFIGRGGWLLNYKNGFLYTQSDKDKPPHPSFLWEKFHKWDMNNFNKNRHLFIRYAEEDYVEEQRNNRYVSTY